MTATLLGLPYPVWGGLCLALALVWAWAWPRRRAPAGGARRFILRWFHALVWLLLATAAILAGLGGAVGRSAGPPLALLALAAYLVFLFALLTTRPNR